MATSTSQVSPGVNMRLEEKSELETAHTGAGYLCGRVFLPGNPGRCYKIVPDQGGVIRELGTGKLHPVATITCKLYHYIFNLLNRFN